MPYIGKPQSADAFRVTPSNIDSALKSGISGSNDSEMTLATASIAAITSSISELRTHETLSTASIAAITASISRLDTEAETNETNMTLATASIAAITASLGQPVNTDSDVTFGDITSTGTITAVEVHTTFVSSSIAVASGSNNFGDALDDLHSFTGSLSVSGSQTTLGIGKQAVNGVLDVQSPAAEGNAITVQSSAASVPSIYLRDSNSHGFGRIHSNNDMQIGTNHLTVNATKVSGSAATTGSFGHIRIGTAGNIDLNSEDVIIRNLVSNKDLIFRGNDGGIEVEAMRINYSGNNVGVGTSGIGAKLHVQDNRSTAYSGTAEPAETMIVQNASGSDGTGVNRFASLSLQVGDGATSQGFINYVRTGDNNGKFTFSQRTAGSTYVEGLTISGSKVGINESAPAEMLEISQTSSPAIQLTQTGGTEYNGIIRLAGNDLEIRGSGGIMEFYNGANDGDSSTLRMKIDADGDVSITERLTVGSWDNSNSHGHGNFDISSDANEGADSYLNFSAGTAIKAHIAYDHHATKNSQVMRFNVGDDALNIMNITGNGAITVTNDTLNPDGVSHTAFSVSTIKTAGSTDSSDTYMGYRNHLEWADSDQGWGSIYGWFNNTQISAGAGESNQVLASYDKLSWESGDADNLFGKYTEVVCEGGTVDTNVFGQQTFVNIDSGVTLSNAVYGQQIKIDGDVNPADAYYGLQISQQGGQMHGSDDFFMLLFDDQNDDIVAQITALAGVATFDSGDFNGAPDYAEYFETKDGKIISPGTTIKLDGDKVVPCEDGDTPIGVARPDGTSAIVGNAKTLGYTDKYLKTDYDEIIMEDYKLVQWVEEIDLTTYRANRQDTKPVLGGNTRYYMEEGTDEAITTKYFRKHSYHSDRLPSGVTVPSDATTQTPNHQRKKLNPDYDPSKADDYKGRATRDEWCLVGLLGQIPITKGQPLASNWIKMKDVSDTVELYFVK